MWLLVAHLLATSATFEFDDFKKPNPTPGPCGADAYPNMQCDVAYPTQNSICPTRSIFVGYSLGAEDTIFTWVFFGGVRNVYSISRLLSSPYTGVTPYIGVHYSLTNPMNLSGEQYFYVNLDYNKAEIAGGDVQIAVTTNDGTATCHGPIPAVPLLSQTTVFCSVSSMAMAPGMTAASLAATTGLDLTISMAGDGSMYMRGFGTAVPLSVSVAQNKTIFAGTTGSLDFVLNIPIKGAALAVNVTLSPVGINGSSYSLVSLPVSSTGWTSSFTIANAAQPGVYKVTATYLPATGNLNLLLYSSTIFWVTINKLPITSLGSLTMLFVTPDVTNSSLFNFTTNNQAINGAVRLTPTSSLFIFDPPYVLVAPGAKVSDNLRVHAKEDTPPGIYGFSVTLLGEAGNNNDLSIGSYTFTAVITVAQDALTSVTISSLTLEAGAAGQNAMLTANVRPVGGTITLTPISAWLNFTPSSISFRGTTTAGPFLVAALPGAPKDVNTVQVLITAGAGNNNGIPQSLLTVSTGTVTVTQPPITTISQLQSLTNVTAGGTGVTITYVLPKIALNGSVIVNLAAPNLVFSPNSLIIAKNTDRGNVVVTAQSGAVPGVIAVTATMSSGVNNNNAVTTSPISVDGLQVIQYLIDSAVVTSTVSVAAGDDINQRNTTIRLPVPVVNGPVLLALSASTASKISFWPPSLTILPGSTDTISFEVKAASDAPAGLADITVGISKGSGNNNRLAQLSFVISNAVNVSLIPIIDVTANHESGPTQRNHIGTTTFTLSTLKVVNGPITVTPAAQGIQFNPLSLDVPAGQVQTASFTYSVSSNAQGGSRNVAVTLTGSNNNNNRMGSLFTAGTLTILDADIPTNITLSPSVSFVAGMSSGSTHFHLETVASNGTITITPTYTGLIFTPSSVIVAAEATDSAAFTVTVDPAVDLSQQPFPVALTLSQNEGNNNNLLSGYTILLPVTGLPIHTVTYNQAPARIYAGYSVTNQRVTVDAPVLRQPVSLVLSSPFFDFVPSTVTIPVGSSNSDFFTLVAKPNAVPGANSFNVDFPPVSGNNNILPLTTVAVTGVTVEQKAVTDLWVLTPITVHIGSGPSSETQFWLDEPAVNGSIVLTPNHPQLLFVPSSIIVPAGSNVSNPFTVTAPENMPAIGGASFPVVFAKGEGNNNLLPDNSPPQTSNNGIYITQPAFAAITLNQSLSINVGHDWSPYVALVFDVPMLNDSGVFTFVDPENHAIEFSTLSVTVEHGSTVSSPFQLKLKDFVEKGPYTFTVMNAGGLYLNIDLVHSNMVVSGVNATYAAITSGTIPSTTVYAGGNQTQSLNITINEAPVYSDINLLLSGDNLVFTPNVVKVLKGQLVSEPFTITADGAATAGARVFYADVVEGGTAHNSWTQLNIDLTVGQLRWDTLSWVTTPHVVAGSSLGATFQIRADKPAINGNILVTSQTIGAPFCMVSDTDCYWGNGRAISVMFSSGSDVSATAKVVVPRSFRPGVLNLEVSVAPLDTSVNMVEIEGFLTLPGLIVEDGYGPLLNITNIAPAMNSATLTVTSDEASSVWCKAVLRGATAPSYPNGYTDHPADVNFTAAGSKAFNLTGLASNTEYDLYCYGVDTVNNKDVASEVTANKAVFKTIINPDQLNRMGPAATGLAPASVAGIVIGAIIGVLLLILLAVGIKRWLNSRSDWTKNESLFLEAELAQKKKPAGEAASSAAPSSPAPGASPAPAPAAAVVSTSGKGNDGLPTL